MCVCVCRGFRGYNGGSMGNEGMRKKVGTEDLGCDEGGDGL